MSGLAEAESDLEPRQGDMRVERERFTWTYAGCDVQLPIERTGVGPAVLLMPALSSISTLREMSPLRDLLARDHATASLDWPGFGEAPRPSFDWTRVALGAYLDHVLEAVAPGPLATVAAGHAAAYLLGAARRRPGTAGRLVLVAPTWRGPLPTMMGRRSRLGRALVRLGDVPGLGQVLYRLNVNRPMVKLMGREHVYDDASWLDTERLAAKMAVTSSAGARHGALRFVTGELDPMRSQEDFLSVARQVRDPILLVYGANAPPKSRREMEALAALPNVEVRLLDKGKLAVHEEYPHAVFEALAPSLRRWSAGA